MPDASTETKEFIRLMERHELWTLQNRDQSLLERAQLLAGRIIKDKDKALQISPQVWAQFIALLPFEQSLKVLSDLSIITKGLLRKIITLRNMEAESVILARDIIISRLNVLVRREIHTQVLTPECKDAINSVIGILNGYNK